MPATEPAARERATEEPQLGLMASDAEALRHKAFAACTPEELAALRRIMARIRLTPPRRRTRRTVAAPAGPGPRPAPDGARVDAACTASPAELRWRRRKDRLRPLILILDISGSMADYSRNLLQFAYSASARGRRGSRCSASAPG